jgi:hypothetical protein
VLLYTSLDQQVIVLLQGLKKTDSNASAWTGTNLLVPRVSLCQTQIASSGLALHPSAMDTVPVAALSYKSAHLEVVQLVIQAPKYYAIAVQTRQLLLRSQLPLRFIYRPPQLPPQPIY